MLAVANVTVERSHANAVALGYPQHVDPLSGAPPVARPCAGRAAPFADVGPPRTFGWLIQQVLPGGRRKSAVAPPQVPCRLPEALCRGARRESAQWMDIAVM